MRDYEIIISLAIGMILGIFMAAFAFDNVKPIKLVTVECYVEKNNIKSILYRVKCPEVKK